MNREGPRNYVTLPLLVSHSSPSFFTRIDTPFHPLTHNLPFSKSGAERSLIAILNRNRTSNSFESTFYQFSNKKLNRPSFFFPSLIFSILIRRNWFHVLSVFLYSASLYRTVIFFSKYVSIKHPRRWALTLFIFPIKVEIYANVSTVYFNVSSPMGRKDALFCPGKIGRLPGRLFYSPCYADRRRTHPEFPGVVVLLHSLEDSSRAILGRPRYITRDRGGGRGGRRGRRVSSTSGHFNRRPWTSISWRDADRPIESHVASCHNFLYAYLSFLPSSILSPYPSVSPSFSIFNSYAAYFITRRSSVPFDDSILIRWSSNSEARGNI